MEKFIIRGGNRLYGRVRIKGAKNSVLPLLAGALLTDEKVALHDCPDISDVRYMLEILKSLGVSVGRTGDDISVWGGVRNGNIPEALAKEIRSSVFLMGSLVGKHGRARVAYPGGCDIGLRPIDVHVKALRELNINIDEQSGYINCSSDEIRGADVQLDKISVGATENAIMAAVLAKGRTTIRNAAKEPEIADLADMLNKMGAKIRGAGTDTIRIEGVKELHGADYTIIPDRIEAGTYMIAAAMTGGDVIVENVLPEHQKPLIAKLREAGALVVEDIDKVRVVGRLPLKPVAIKTLPYPGFPTDMQAQMMAMMVIADGRSKVTETVFENRFMHVVELNRMGARITTEGRSAVVEGPSPLTGCDVRATDLRAGAAMILAGLVAEGVTRIGDIYHIDRGYENIVDKLKSLGASIERVQVD